MTAQELINSALRLIGAIGQGETPSTSESLDGLATLNDLIDNWNTARENLFVVGPATYTLSVAKTTYTIGPGATDFNTARPLVIQTATVIPAGTNLKLPLDLSSSLDFASIRELGLIGTPQKLYCDYAYPIANLSFWPLPSQVGGSPRVEIFSQSALSRYTNLSDNVVAPPGYARALRYNLAVDLYPEYPLVDQKNFAVVAGIAQSSKADMQRLNAQFLQTAVGQQTTGSIPNIGIPSPTQPQ